MTNLSEKLLRILRAKAPFSEDQLSLLTEQQGWDWIYAHAPKKPRVDQVCFTGFGVGECDELAAMAKAIEWLQVVTGITTKLAYLVVGANAGPSKLAKARAQHVTIIDRSAFERLVYHGEVPSQEQEA